mmetsp:Transcript_14414/g.58394  ORF Transcript_14414/g.58394 Transcript_14414/m.58394 type:complete len:89 (-) Transcript_14414:50-316(-)
MSFYLHATSNFQVQTFFDPDILDLLRFYEKSEKSLTSWIWEESRTFTTFFTYLSCGNLMDLNQKISLRRQRFYPLIHKERLSQYLGID